MHIVNLTQFFPYTWMLYIVRAFIIYSFSSSMLKKKFNTVITFFATVTILMIYSFISVTFFSPTAPWLEIVSLIIYFIVVFGVNILLYDNTITKKLGATFFFAVGYLVASLISSGILTLTPDNNIKIEMDYEMHLDRFVLSIALVFFASFIPLAIIRTYVRLKGEFNFTNKKYIIFYLFPTSHILLVYLILKFETYIISNKANTNYDNLFKTTFVVLTISFLMDFVLMFYIDYFNKLERKGIQNEKLSLQNELYYKNIKILTDRYNNFSKLRHDLVNLNSVAIGFLELGNTEKALEILKETNEKAVELSTLKVSKNELLNTILDIKKSQARDIKIDLNISLVENTQLKINDYDICRIIVNIIDNCLNATKLACGSECFFEMNIDDDEVSITTKNPFVNIKKDNNINHGWGTKIISEIAKSYNGSYSHQIIDNNYLTLTILKNKTQS